LCDLLRAGSPVRTAVRRSRADDPSWVPIFGKIGATVTDVGGMMSHAAIVSREYGLPAVTGTVFGTKRIKPVSASGWTERRDRR
jgi:phosphoenolpyruvate synthase/pyruvate phosphate dikinase